MKNILILLAFIVSFNTFAERVYIKNYFDNGIMKSEGWTENNKKIEHWKYYHTNGKLEKAGDYKIDFGNLTEMDVKFKKLKAFYNKAFEDKTIQNYKAINLKYHNQVVCTK